ncbi:MAG: hypothetical protein B6U85_03590 [Desulfurococcales archaeon ex4484_42]|nr:MAG: hypothetical protein B6U85_03590 [Desulfurococcales archaeon ex4484_42]
MAKLPFQVKPFIIGMVHVGPLPGTPLYKGNFDEVVKNAIRDARTLEEGGVDGIIIENFNDKIYRIGRADPAVTSSMTLIVNEVRKEVSIPIGINVLRDCVLDSLAIAYVTKSSFIRVNALVETIDAPEGILKPSAYKLNMYRSVLRAWNIAILADIHVKHGKPLTGRDIDVVAREAIERGLADAVIITGRITGEAIDLNDLIRVKKVVNTPIIIGSGLNPDNAKELLRYADGAIVGTYFKANGRVSIEKVRRFMNVIKELRRKFD